MEWEMQKCDICGEESKFQSFWIFCINKTAVDPRFFPRIFMLRNPYGHLPEVVRICRRCRYKATVADMYDAVYKRMLNRESGKYAKARKKKPFTKRLAKRKAKR